MPKILVTSNLNPDLDGYACSIGYAEYLNLKGKKAEPILLGELDDETNYVLNIANEKAISQYKDILKGDIRLILVDTTSLESLRTEANPQQIYEIIDHRRLNDAHLFPWAKKQIELVGSCATLIVEKFISENLPIKTGTAYLLYGAIVSNTINFKNRITTERDRKAAEYLLTKITITDDFPEKMFRARTNIEGDNLSRYLHKDFIEQSVQNKKLTVFQMEIVGTDNLIKTSLQEIKNIINSIIKDKKLDYCFLNIIDTIKAYNYILAINSKTEDFLKKVLALDFKNGLVKTDYIIMRKEIMAKIKEYLENE